MLRSRITPCLLVHNRGLVKTVQFSNPKYVGDPLNAVRIFNEKEVDELVVLDIDATVHGKEPDYNMIKNLAAECRMPLCYGGGINTVEQAIKIIKLEKVAISSAAICDSNLVSKIGKQIGSQSVVVVLDVKKKRLSKQYEVYIDNGSKRTKRSVIDLAKEFEALGAGEIVINSIDNDGMMKGYDFELINQVRAAVNIPITALGGAGSLGDIGQLISKFNVIGAAAGSLFVFKGVYKAVLINYPSHNKKVELIKRKPNETDTTIT